MASMIARMPPLKACSVVSSAITDVLISVIVRTRGPSLFCPSRSSAYLLVASAPDQKTVSGKMTQMLTPRVAAW